MKSFFQSFILGTLAALATLITFSVQLPTWILFVAWTSYFLFGKNIKSSLSALAQQILGIIIAILITKFGNFLGDKLVSPHGFHFSVLAILTGVFYLSKLPFLNILPAYFLGMVVWFGADPIPNVENVIKIVMTLTTGYCFGWVNDRLNTQINPGSQ